MANKVVIQFWVSGELEKEIIHKEGRHPKIGWEILTVLEAKADGARQCLVRGNKEGAINRISDIISITRRLIKRRKLNMKILENRCTYKDVVYSVDNSGGVCDKYPVKKYKGKWFCKKHLDKYKEDWKRMRQSVLTK